MTCRRFYFSLLFSLTAILAGCDSSRELSVYETDAGEMAVRQLIKSLPELNPSVAKNYCIVLGEITQSGLMTPASTEFVKRFADLKLRFVNAIDLKVIEPGPIIVDNETRLATFVLQLRVVRQLSEAKWEAEMGWSYKDQFERKKMMLETKDGKLVVVSETKMEQK